MTVSIQITGVDALIKKLGRAQGIEHLRPPMVNAVARLHRRMADYPAPPPNSTYKRTTVLGKTWTTKVTTFSNGLEGKVGNKTPYVPRVQSYRFQARIHRGRWQTDRYVMETEYRAIVRDFEDTIQRRLNG